MIKLAGPEHIPAGPVTQAVIFLHGLGSNGADLLSLAPMIEADLPHTAFLAPNAPTALPYGYGGYQWFELWGRTPKQMESEAATAAPLIAEYVRDTALRLALPVSKIALVGFSQGTMMALYAGLRLQEDLAGIIGYAGAMIGPDSFPAAKLKKLPPVLLVHGLLDNVVPFGMSQMAEQVIRAAGGDVRLVTRPHLMHSIDDEAIAEGVRFLKTVFQTEGPK